MRGQLDWMIAQFYRGDPNTLEATVRNILRTAVYQLRFTDRIPAFAVLNEAVGIAKSLQPAVAGLVNAVLRTTLRQKDALEWPSLTDDAAGAIAILHSHPLWLVRRLIAQFGPEETVAICSADNAMAPLALRVNSLKAARPDAVAALAAEGIAAEATALSPDGLRLTSPGAALRESAAYKGGLVRIQDEASQLVARLVAPKPGERILDLCAGAGGKTLHLAALMNNRGLITALDLHEDRLRMLREEAKRLGVTIVETRAGDAAEPHVSFSGTFDRVLLDAPCSGLGTLRRNPEIRWRITAGDLKKCMETQRRLLANAAECVRPGGRLVYSVCTVTPEENELVVADLLKNRPEFSRVAPPAGEIDAALFDAAGDLRTFPHRHGADGFFAAVLTRKGT